MKVLVFGAHPDDMEVGMGGTIAKHASFGDEIRMVVGTVPSLRGDRMDEAKKGAEILGADLQILDLPSEDLVFDRKIVGRIDKIVTEVQPDLIYTQWDQDSHQDHNVISRGVISACRKNRCSLFMYEQTIPGGIVPGGFRTQAYVDITDFIDKKIDSIRAHASQWKIHGDRWLQGVRGRASYRGFQINCDYAESFEVIKDIESHFRHR